MDDDMASNKIALPETINRPIESMVGIMHIQN